MNRREALAALMALPAVASVARAEMRPHDVIVVRIKDLISDEMASRIRSQMQEVWPDNKCIVLCGDVSMEIVRKS